MSRARLALAGLFCFIGVCLLVSLGLWQLRRLAWKEGLIATVEARAHGEPAPLPPPSDWAALQPGDYNYRRVRVSGVFDYDRQEFVFRGLEAPRGRYGGVGYFVMTPLALPDGESVIVNRGFVPDTMKGDAERGPRGPIVVTGLMRETEPRTWFTPADEPANHVFFTQDVAALARAMKLGPHAPFSIDADAGPDPLPEGGETRLTFPNNHLGYAFTWFGMAAALVGVFAALVRSEIRKKI